MEIRRGLEITPALMTNILSRIFAKINTLDYSQFKLTTGQFYRTKDAVYSNLLSTSSDQYFKTDIIYDSTYSSLQKYIDDVENLLAED
jgi:hypothetical protein